MTVYEEVASQALLISTSNGEDKNITSTKSAVQVEGSIYVQVTGSDANKNAPFALKQSTSSSLIEGSNLSVKPNTRYTTQALAEESVATSTDIGPDAAIISPGRHLIVHGTFVHAC